MQFPEFREFQARQSIRSENGEDVSEHERTPDEVLDSADQVLRGTLAQDLLERVKSSSPRFFERVVVDLRLAMGYGGSGFDAGRVEGHFLDSRVPLSIAQQRRIT